jgi:hypothetical protein
MQRVVDFLETLRRFGRKLGPYLMLEILLPGGSLFALALFLYQRRKATGRAAPSPIAALTRLWAGLAPQGVFMTQPCYLLRPSREMRSRPIRSDR